MSVAARLPATAVPPGVIHLWRVPLNQPEWMVAELGALLSPDEAERACRFRFARDARRFSVARGALRTILAGYLELAPSEIAFTYAAHGKPSLDFDGAPAAERVEFNLSHSGELAAVALTRGSELGVDIERIRPLDDLDQLARTCFSPREQLALNALPGVQRERAFFSCWTRKEAYLKALGDGLALPLDSFDVALAPGEPAALLRVDGDPGAAERWTIVDLEPERGHAGALAVEGSSLEVTSFTWTE